MKPYRIDSDVFFVTRQAWIADLQAKWQPVDFRLLAGIVVLGVILTACLLAAVPDYQEDFTDSGVGCINDCLEPAEPMPLEP